MDPFLLGLILACVSLVAVMQGVVTDSINWGFVGYTLLAVVLVFVLLTTNWGA